MTIGTPLDLLDIHGVLVRYLRADTQVTDLVEQRIFARKFPERMDFPAIRVDFPQSTPATYPAPAWYTFIGDVECYADTHQQALDLVRVVQRALFALEGSEDPDGAFAAVDAHSVVSGVDETLVSPKPQWSVAVEITARTR